MFVILQEADLVSNRKDKHGLIRGPGIREKALLFVVVVVVVVGKATREGSSHGRTHLNCISHLRGDFQTKKGLSGCSMHMCKGPVVVPFMTKGWDTSFQ